MFPFILLNRKSIHASGIIVCVKKKLEKNTGEWFGWLLAQVRDFCVAVKSGEVEGDEGKHLMLLNQVSVCLLCVPVLIRDVSVWKFSVVGKHLMLLYQVLFRMCVRIRDVSAHAYLQPMMRVFESLWLWKEMKACTSCLWIRHYHYFYYYDYDYVYVLLRVLNFWILLLWSKKKEGKHLRLLSQILVCVCVCVHLCVHSAFSRLCMLFSCRLYIKLRTEI
jgi:hypothetical protein